LQHIFAIPLHPLRWKKTVHTHPEPQPKVFHHGTRFLAKSSHRRICTIS
jgi:hypothetical protein